MANVKFSRKEFENKVGKITEEMQEKIAYFGTPLENLDAKEIELEIFPNRPDLLSLQGYLRGFLGFLGKKNTTGLQSYKVNKPKKNYSVKVDASVKQVRPFTACAIVKNLKFDDEKIKEIIDIQEKLHTTVGRNRKKVAIGIYPLEKIKLPIVYRAEVPDKITFVPLEENKQMTGRQILSRTSTGREYAHLLDKAEKYPVFRDSSGEVLSMPPIINSHLTGKITQETKEVFIECSGFDLSALKKVLNIIVTLLADLGGEIYSMVLQYGNKKEITPDLTSEKLKIKIEDAEKLLGIGLREQEVKKLLGKMGYNYNIKNKEVEIPAWRVDILHPVDIYEDLAIGYGYENFSPALPEISTIGKESQEAIRKRKISEILVGLGLLEVSNYHLCIKKDVKKTLFKPEIEVLDSKTDYNTLRPSLLVNCMKVLSENIDARYSQKIFEIGRVFHDIEEKEKLCVLIAGETDFTEIKQTLEYLFKQLDREFKIEETEHPSFINGRTGKIIFEGREIGVLGEVSPTVLKNFNMKMPAVALEMEIGEI